MTDITNLTDMLTDNTQSFTEPGYQPNRAAASGTIGRSMRPMTIDDSLYGDIKVSAWAAALLATPPFARLAHVSLSDVPGELLFRHSFPSRLDHTIGVYHLARVARPRDRTLQVAALAHDLGHGPFSHLSESLMIERLGMDHETRSICLLAEVRSNLSATVAQHLSWLDWDEVAALMRGEGRGALLNGRLDYDNADNVARFMLHADFGQPGYDPRVLARGLRFLATNDEVNDSQLSPTPVSLQTTVEQEGRAWQADRAVVYRFLHAGGTHGHRNLAAHAMLRKAVDMAAATHILPADFFDLTDAEALNLLSNGLDRGLIAVMRRVQGEASSWYRCIWEAEIPADDNQLPALQAHAHDRLALEAQLAAEAGLVAHEVICDALVSNAPRALPPLAPPNRPTALIQQPEAATSPRTIHLFIAPGYGADYARRLTLAAERRFAPLGAHPRTIAE